MPDPVPAPASAPAPAPASTPAAAPAAAAAPVVAPVVSPLAQPGPAPSAPAAPTGEPPATYDLKFPEGAPIDEKLLNEAAIPLFREMKLPVAQAQKVADLGVKMAQGFRDAADQAWQNQRKGWIEQAKADPEIGGAKLDETVSNAHRAIQAFLKPDEAVAFREYAGKSGVFDHPLLLKLLARAGAGAQEDGHAPRIAGPQRSDTPPTREERLQRRYSQSNLKLGKPQG